MKRNEIYNTKASKCYSEETIDLITVDVKPCVSRVRSLVQHGTLQGTRVDTNIQE